MDALRTHLLRCSHGEERIAAHDAMRDAVYYIIQDAGRTVLRERMLDILMSNVLLSNVTVASVTLRFALVHAQFKSSDIVKLG